MDRDDWLTMQDVDQRAGRPKGSAFRAFKKLLPELREGPDFAVLDHNRHDAYGARLYAEGRIYRSSVSPVLMSPATAQRVLRQLGNASFTDN